MTVKELFERLGELADQGYGDWEVAHNEGHGPALYRVDTVTINPDHGPHGWPDFARLDGDRWPDIEWRPAAS